MAPDWLIIILTLTCHKTTGHSSSYYSTFSFYECWALYSWLIVQLWKSILLSDVGSLGKYLLNISSILHTVIWSGFSVLQHCKGNINKDRSYLRACYVNSACSSCNKAVILLDIFLSLSQVVTARACSMLRREGKQIRGKPHICTGNRLVVGLRGLGQDGFIG